MELRNEKHKFSFFLAYKKPMVCMLDMSAPPCFGSRNASVTCYMNKGFLRAANLSVAVEW